jgi:hypothetical protein
VGVVTAEQKGGRDHHGRRGPLGLAIGFLTWKLCHRIGRNVSKHARVRSAAELEWNVRCSCQRQTSAGPSAPTFLLRGHWRTVVWKKHWRTRALVHIRGSVILRVLSLIKC